LRTGVEKRVGGIVQAPDNQHRVRNTIGWRQRLARLQGSPVVFDLRGYEQEMAEVNRLGRDAERLSDGEIEARPASFASSAGRSARRVFCAWPATPRAASSA